MNVKLLVHHVISKFQNVKLTNYKPEFVSTELNKYID